jgi:AraC-like DNA-binding protein
VGWSARTLQYRVTEQIGVSPKRWLRIERLHRAIAALLIDGRTWSDIAADCGFADQSHMAREFVDLLGESPTTWRKRGPFVPPEASVATDDDGPFKAAALAAT